MNSQCPLRPASEPCGEEGGQPDAELPPDDLDRLGVDEHAEEEEQDGLGSEAAAGETPVEETQLTPEKIVSSENQ